MKEHHHVSGIKKYTPSFEYTKQMAKERLGVASNSVDTLETKALKEKISHIKHTLRDVKSSGIEYIEQMAILAEKGAAFSEALTSFGKLSSGDVPISNTVCLVGEMVKNQSASTKASAMSASSQVVSPLIKIYEEELSQILILRHEQERARVQYEAQAARLKDFQRRGTKRLPSVEAETIFVKENYDKITTELSQRCDGLILKMETELQPSLQAYISFQAAFFTNLSEQMKRMEKAMAFSLPKIEPSDGAGAGCVDRAELARQRSQSSPPAPAGKASM